MYGSCFSSDSDLATENRKMPPGKAGPGHAERPLKLKRCPFKISTTGSSHQSSTHQNSCYKLTSRGHMKGAAPCCLSPPLFYSLAAFVWLFPAPSYLALLLTPTPPPLFQCRSTYYPLTSGWRQSTLEQSHLFCLQCKRKMLWSSFRIEPRLKISLWEAVVMPHLFMILNPNVVSDEFKETDLFKQRMNRT